MSEMDKELTVWLIDRFDVSWEMTRLVEELGRLGIRGQVVEWSDIQLGSGLPQQRGQSNGFRPAAASIQSRVLTRHTRGDAALLYDWLELLEELGIRITNPAAGIRRCRNKVRQAAALSAKGLPVPDTKAVNDGAEIGDCLDAWGETVLKPIWGHASIDVTRLRGRGRPTGPGVPLALREEIVTWHLFQKYGQLCAQRFVPNSGRDLRVAVIGEQIGYCMWHVSSAPDQAVRHFLFPLRRESVKVTPEMERLAVSAVKCLGLDCAVLDVVEGDEGLTIIEVNEGISVWEDVEGTEFDLTDRGFTVAIAEQLAAVAKGG